MNSKQIFIDAVIKSIQKGLSVEKGKDFDYLKIEEVHSLLKDVL
jgi:hypothetical protein